MKTSQSHDRDKMQFRLLDKIKTICWSLNKGGNHFLHIIIDSRDFPPPKLLMLLCFMFVSSRETPACLAAPEVCTRCPTGAPHQAQGTSPLFPSTAFHDNSNAVQSSAEWEGEKSKQDPSLPLLCLSVSLFVCGETFGPPHPSGHFWDWTQAVRTIQCTSSF